MRNAIHFVSGLHVVATQRLAFRPTDPRYQFKCYANVMPQSLGRDHFMANSRIASAWMRVVS
jgi:hypothetical protein